MSTDRYTTTIRLSQDEGDTADRIAKENGFGNRAAGIRYAVNTYHSCTEQLRRAQDQIRQLRNDLQQSKRLSADFIDSYTALVAFHKPEAPKEQPSRQQSWSTDEEE